MLFKLGVSYTDLGAKQQIDKLGSTHNASKEGIVAS
jgi:hypothetical protein